MPARKKVVVYTAFSAGYDQLQPVAPVWAKGADHVAFLETKTERAGWKIRKLHRGFEDPCRNAKNHKVLAHDYFPEHDFSIWVDGSVRIVSTVPLERLLPVWLEGADFAVFRHRTRKCIYQEAAACIGSRKDAVDKIVTQAGAYYGAGYPADHGLAECTVLVRRHTKAVAAFNAAWHEEISQHSRRDQLSFNYVADKLRLKVAYLKGSIARNSHFLWLPHLARPVWAGRAGKIPPPS